MTRLSVEVDPELVQEAKRLANAKTKREAIERALREFVQRRRRAGLAELEGSGIIDMSVEELLKWRRKAIHQR